MENVHRTGLSHPLTVVASIAVILFCAAGVAAIMGWIPKSGADSEPPSGASSSAPAKAAAPAVPAAAAKPHPLQVSAAPAARARVACGNCGVIESIREIEKQGEAQGVGAVTGGVLGGVVGHQMGSGRGRDVMTVVGAVGGAVAGHQIEKNMKRTKVYEIRVRFEDGSTRALSQAAAPAWRVGDRVKLVNGELRPNA